MKILQETCLHCREDKLIWDVMAGKRRSVDLDGSLNATLTYCEKHKAKLEENLRLIRSAK